MAHSPLDTALLKIDDRAAAVVLQPPEIITQEIVDDLHTALDEFATVAEALQLAKAEREGHVADQR